MILAEGVGVEEMAVTLRVAVKEKKIQDIWAESTSLALYKSKGNALECAKYRGLRLLEHRMQTLETSLTPNCEKFQGFQTINLISGQRSQARKQSSR